MNCVCKNLEESLVSTRKRSNCKRRTPKQNHWLLARKASAMFLLTANHASEWTWWATVTEIYNLYNFKTGGAGGHILKERSEMLLAAVRGAEPQLPWVLYRGRGTSYFYLCMRCDQTAVQSRASERDFLLAPGQVWVGQRASQHAWPKKPFWSLTLTYALTQSVAEDLMC